MNNALKDGLIRAMKDKMPGGNNLASALTEILCIGKEAVYRRLRGEVAFTFNEAAAISRELGISLDKIIGNSSPGSTVFDLNLPEMTDSLNNYYGILTRYLNFFRHIKTDPQSTVCTASNIIPFTFYSPYENISKFRLCRWAYQNHHLQRSSSLSEMDVPQKIIDTHIQLSKEIRQVPNTDFILDNTVFSSLVNEIKYFSGLNLISAKDTGNLKAEIHAMLNEMECMSISGSFNNGNKLQIYLSNINFEATYSYIERRDFQICLFRVYSINSMDSQNSKICNIQKDWIQFLKRHSTLVSQSGEMQRIMFFNQQRNMVDSI